MQFIVLRTPPKIYYIIDHGWDGDVVVVPKFLNRRPSTMACWVDNAKDCLGYLIRYTGVMSKDDMGQITSFTLIYVSLKLACVENTMTPKNLRVDWKLIWL